ncbi:Ig-like domain-containing protein, partial [Vibrio crassostreae]|uniref:Ig-like domain-containing protein n=1 Tax=Vibrio crassostreae TaxID=246167 RepID=UPI001B305D76
MVEGTSTILLVNGEYSNGTVEQLTNQVEWESSDLSVLSVNKNGHLLALSPGTLTLTATKDDVTSEPVEIDVVQAAA